MEARDAPLIVVVGPTASGKTALAIEMAEKYDGEIICADSRTVYKGMDIGTAKPTAEEQRRVPHHLLDVVQPDESFTVADFQELAYQAITDIRRRHKIPFLVGGSGLYIDSVIFDYKFGERKPDVRKKLEQMTIHELQDYSVKNNIELPENDQNKRYLVRAIEQGGVNRTKRRHPIPDTLVVGITTPAVILRERITQRARELFEKGVVKEAIEIGQMYGWRYESMTGNVYRLAQAIHQGELTVTEAEAKFVTLDWKLAKKQATWFKRNPFIVWGDIGETKSSIETYLNGKT